MIRNIFLILLFLSSLVAEEMFVRDKSHILCQLKKNPLPLPPNLKPVLSRTLGTRLSYKSRSFTYKSSSLFDIEYMAKNEISPFTYNNRNVICETFPENAKSALRRATDIWSSYIDSNVPIKVKVCWSSVNIGSTLAITLTHFAGYEFPILQQGIMYPFPLLNAIIYQDYPGYIVNGAGISILFNNSQWYFGIDGSPEYNKMDFISTAVHELGHGLGFTGGVNYNGYDSNYNGLNIFDTFVENGLGNKTRFLSNNQLGQALTSNNLFFNAPNANSSNNNARVKLYAPSRWEIGSSYGHLDNSTFNRGANRLMTTTLMAGDVIRDPGSVTIGMFRDLGWKAPRKIYIQPIQDIVIPACNTFNFTAKTTSVFSNVLWSLTNFPSGMSINSSNGNITWQNPTSGTYQVTVKALYSITGDYDTKTFTILVESGECKHKVLPSVIMYLLN